MSLSSSANKLKGRENDMDLSERKLKILQAIISDFIRSAEPVGSRTLSKKYDLGVGPATIRNEMADLEDDSYLTQNKALSLKKGSRTAPSTANRPDTSLTPVGRRWAEKDKSR